MSNPLTTADSTSSETSNWPAEPQEPPSTSTIRRNKHVSPKMRPATESLARFTRSGPSTKDYTSLTWQCKIPTNTMIALPILMIQPSSASYQKAISTLEAVPGTEPAKVLRLARTENRIANIPSQSQYEQNRWRDSARWHYCEAFNRKLTSVEDWATIDFDGLVPVIDR